MSSSFHRPPSVSVTFILTWGQSAATAVVTPAAAPGSVIDEERVLIVARTCFNRATSCSGKFWSLSKFSLTMMASTPSGSSMRTLPSRTIASIPFSMCSAIASFDGPAGIMGRPEWSQQMRALKHLSPNARCVLLMEPRSRSLQTLGSSGS